jgi:hypothetical protein
MIFALQGYVAFNTTNDRDQVVQFLTGGGTPRVAPTTVTPTGTWQNRVVSGAQFDTGKPGIALEVRYLTRQEADDLWTDIISALGSRSVQPGSFLYAHDCTNDEPGVNNCVITFQQSW